MEPTSVEVVEFRKETIGLMLRIRRDRNPLDIRHAPLRRWIERWGRRHGCPLVIGEIRTSADNVARDMYPLPCRYVDTPPSKRILEQYPHQHTWLYVVACVFGAPAELYAILVPWAAFVGPSVIRVQAVTALSTAMVVEAPQSKIVES